MFGKPRGKGKLKWSGARLPAASAAAAVHDGGACRNRLQSSAQESRGRTHEAHCTAVVLILLPATSSEHRPLLHERRARVPEFCWFRVVYSNNLI